MDDESRKILIDLQRQMAVLVRLEDDRRKTKARRRGKRIAYSPPRERPGPKATELDIARARRLLRG
jgi:hypothetical protein